MELFYVGEQSLLLEGQFSFYLILLSFAIALISSYLAFHVSSIASTSTSVLRTQISIFIGSIALGGGVWSMHFIGMLAFELCTQVTYSWEITLISILPSIAASWVALQFLTNDVFKTYQLIVSGTLVGLGIGSMHYIGMAAMEMAPLLRYDLPIFMLSIVVAAVFACISLWIKFSLQDFWGHKVGRLQQTLIAAFVMAVAISGMHYTGMAAARFVMPPGFELSEQSSDISMYLAIIIAICTVVSTGSVIAATIILKYKDISTIARLSEKRLSATINASIDGIITINDKGAVMGINYAVEQMLGWKESELLGKNVNILIPGDNGLNHDNHLKNYLENKSEQVVGVGRIVTAISKSGEEVPVKLGIGHVELENEHMFVGYISDLRTQLKMEQALKENEEKFRSLISNIPGIAYRCLDIDARPMVFVNDEIETITGYPSDDFTLPAPSRNFADFVVEEDLQKILEVINKSEDQFNIEYRIKDRFGKIRWMLGYGRKIKQLTDGKAYIDGLIMDISPRKFMEEQLVIERNKAQQAAEARTEFMANMSHEIRTPMNAIIGFSDILLEAPLEQEQQKFVKTINESAYSLLHIINDILDSAKLDKGQMSLEQSTFSIIELLDSVVSTFALQAKKKGIALLLEVDIGSVEYVIGAMERIRQILNNIVGNAIKFTHEGSVEINVVQLEDDYIQFEIVDDGIGMKEDQIERIFEPFIQADATMSRKYGGTGLGTTIAKQLVDLMKGDISVKSTFGVGTTFTIVLPLPKASGNHRANRPELSSIKTLTQAIRPLNILVADDVQQNLDLLTHVLKRAGHTATCVKDGQQALDAMSSHQFDIVLMDLQMPTLDGLCASKKRRQYEESQKLTRTPIIALTASVLENDRLAAKRAGMDGFANKPIVPDDLYNEIQRVLDKKESHKKSSQMTLQNASCINIQRGTALWGDTQLLMKEISIFINDNNLSSLLTFVVNGKALGAEHLSELHKAKGIAGNLGLDNLYKYIQTLESSIESMSKDDLQNLKEKIIIELGGIAEQVTGANKQPHQRDSETNNLVTESFVENLQKLQTMAQHNTFEDELIDQLLAISPDAFIDECLEIEEYCNDFEFQKAEIKIEELLIKAKQSKVRGSAP